MKKYLPLILIGLIFLFFPLPAFAQRFDTSPLQPAVTPAPTEGTWMPDSEVTFVGKMGARAGEFLDWTLQNYNWSHVPNGEENPLVSFWATIRNIVYAFFALFVLITAFILIITRGQNITVMRVIPRFIIIALLVTFSFALIQFIYQIIDIVQGFFLKSPSGPGFISQRDLLFIGFGYKDFLGYRIFGSSFDESVFISLLLIKFTAITYYVMVGVLLIRKIILWFFIIISPIFPLLILYSPVRNTAKIWVKEFFRWLLYAPIFAIFLSGLVHIWRSSTNIPLQFNLANKDVVYPTAINILLGGPGQVLSLTNSVNNKDTFALYVVALLMLWVVIILPFLLLQIFLDYLQTIPFGENNFVKQLLSEPLAPRPAAPTPAVSPSPVSSQPAGMARSLPFGAKISIPEIRESGVSTIFEVGKSSEILRLTNLSIPTMRDIVKYETSLLSSDISRHQDIAKVHETLEGISNPTRITVPSEKQRYNIIQEKLTQEVEKGNPLASSILSAASTVSKTPVPSTMLFAKHAVGGAFPVANRVQSVSIDDYEAVRKMWEENYEHLDPPRGFENTDEGRKEWIGKDSEKIKETINLLTAKDPQNVKKGMEAVGSVLPFLLIGGFSQEEVIAYLKAKLEAAKSVISEIGKKQEEEETKLENLGKKEEKPKEMSAEEKIETSE